MNKLRLSTLVRDGLIVVVVTLGLLLLSELGLRIVFSGKNREIAYQVNEDYLISLKPNLRKYFLRAPSNGGAMIRWETNSLSFRGAELREHPDIRVMVYGDSNIQAQFSNLEDTFCYRLEKYLTERLAGRNVEVVNSGLVGSGPDQSLIKLSKDADIYRPDLIILHLFADNDFGDIVRNRLFDLDEDGNLVRTKFKIEKDQSLVDAESLLSSLFLVKAARKVASVIPRSKNEEIKNEEIKNEEIKNWVSVREKEYAVYREAQPQHFSHFDDQYDIDVAIHPQAESSKTKIKLMEAVLKEAKKVTEAKHIGLLVLIEPSVIDLTENLRISYKDLQKYPDYKRDNLTRSMDAICVSLAIDRVNLFDVFMGNRPEELYFRHPDNHWNDAGQDLAARVTSAYVARNMLAGAIPTSSKGKGDANRMTVDRTR